MRQLRIVHTEASEAWGGQEWRVFLELQWMRKRGHEVWLVASPKSRIMERCRREGIAAWLLTYGRLRFPDELARLTAWLAYQRVDVVNTHSSRDGWLGGLAARLAGVPLIIRSRHIEVDYGWKFIPALGFDYLPHEVLTTSERISQRLAEECHIPRHKITCLPTGIDLERFAPRGPEPTDTLHRELGLPPGTPLVGMVSVLRSWKGHSDFLAAAALLRAQGMPAHYVIVGEGPSRDAIEEQIAELGLVEAVTLLGHREDVPAVLHSLSLLVLPSTAHEGVPQIVLQAQAVGCPVVGTRIGGIPEAIKHGVTGLKAPPGDPAALAAVIRETLEDRAATAERTARAQEGVRSRGSLDDMGRRLEQLYRQRLGLL